MMKRITILALESAASSTIVGPQDIFYLSDRFWNRIDGQMEKKNYFQIEIVGIDSKPVVCRNGLKLLTEKTFLEVTSTDLIILPVIGDNLERGIAQSIPLYPWLVEWHKRGATIAAVGTGVFLLAASGLLNGRIATTHWFYEKRFRLLFPAVHLKPEQLITEDRNLVCCGGNSCFDLPLYFIEKYFGHQKAVQSAKFFVLDFWKPNQIPYTMFDFQKTHDDEVIKQAQCWIEENSARSFSLQELARKSGMSFRTFNRRFLTATGDTPLEYMQRFRVENARHLLEDQSKTINEVSISVGYEDMSFFRKIFKRYTGLSPSEYRKKFQKNSYSD